MFHCVSPGQRIRYSRPVPSAVHLDTPPGSGAFGCLGRHARNIYCRELWFLLSVWSVKFVDVSHAIPAGCKSIHDSLPNLRKTSNATSVLAFHGATGRPAQAGREKSFRQRLGKFQTRTEAHADDVTGDLTRRSFEIACFAALWS